MFRVLALVIYICILKGQAKLEKAFGILLKKLVSLLMIEVDKLQRQIISIVLFVLSNFYLRFVFYVSHIIC